MPATAYHFPFSMKLVPRFVFTILMCAPAFAADSASNVKLTKLADRVRVEVGGSLFTEYVFGDGASRPYCYPVLAADGTQLTRDFPQKETPGEEHDHPW